MPMTIVDPRESYDVSKYKLDHLIISKNYNIKKVHIIFDNNVLFAFAYAKDFEKTPEGGYKVPLVLSGLVPYEMCTRTRFRIVFFPITQDIEFEYPICILEQPLFPPEAIVNTVCDVEYTTGERQMGVFTVYYGSVLMKRHPLDMRTNISEKKEARLDLHTLFYNIVENRGDDKTVAKFMLEYFARTLPAKDNANYIKTILLNPVDMNDAIELMSQIYEESEGYRYCERLYIDKHGYSEDA